jgi:hypothetical protein
MSIIKYFPKAIDEKEATDLYHYMKDNVKWDFIKENGRTHTPICLDYNCAINNRIKIVADKASEIACLNETHTIWGTHLNYYQNGNNYVPPHNHLIQYQVIISLGATRTLIVNDENIKLENGDIVMIGKGVFHSVPIEPEVTEGRISIALFFEPIGNDDTRLF